MLRKTQNILPPHCFFSLKSTSNPISSLVNQINCVYAAAGIKLCICFRIALLLQFGAPYLYVITEHKVPLSFAEKLNRFCARGRAVYFWLEKKSSNNNHFLLTRNTICCLPKKLEDSGALQICATDCSKTTKCPGVFNFL